MRVPFFWGGDTLHMYKNMKIYACTEESNSNILQENFALNITNFNTFGFLAVVIYFLLFIYIEK
jgi:hypothetical protein